MQRSTHFPGDEKNMCLACDMQLTCSIDLCLNEGMHLIECRIYIDLFIQRAL